MQNETVKVIHLDNNEAAFSIAFVPWSARNGELTLVVGTAADTQLTPRTCTSGFLRTYLLKEDGTDLELLHKVSIGSGFRIGNSDTPMQTETDDVPLSLLAFQGKLITGVGKALRLYEIGKKKLLRKSENRVSCLLVDI